MPYVDTGRVSLFFSEAGNRGIPVLLLHELGGSSKSWREVIPLLAPDRRVITADFRCAGRSEKPIGSFELSDIADDIAALLRRWKWPTPCT
jgi:3-oxoadipate enol-lactonase